MAHAPHRVGDRQLDAVAPAELTDRQAGLDALGDLAVVRRLGLGGGGGPPPPPPAPAGGNTTEGEKGGGDEQVATRSPSPARPAKVSGSAPSATPSLLISARPRVIREARLLSPNPMPAAIPTARAITFFPSPPSSQPITSVFV